MGILIDLLIVGFILLFGFLGYRSGFAKEIVSILTLIIAIFLSGLISEPVATFMYDNALEMPVTNAISEKIDSISAELVSPDEIQVAYDKAIEDMPDFLVSMCKLDGVDIKSGFASTENVKDQVVDYINHKVLRPAVISLLTGVLYLVFVLLISKLLGILASSLRVVSYIPVIGGINKILGGVIGIIRGCVYAMAASLILYFFVGDGALIPTEVYENTFIFKAAITCNPLYSTITDFIQQYLK